MKINNKYQLGEQVYILKDKSQKSIAGVSIENGLALYRLFGLPNWYYEFEIANELPNVCSVDGWNFTYLESQTEIEPQSISGKKPKYYLVPGRFIQYEAFIRILVFTEMEFAKFKTGIFNKPK